MTKQSTTIRVGIEQRQQLRMLAEQRGSSMAETFDAAMTALRRELFYEQMATAETALQEDGASWSDFVTERNQWLDAGLESA